MSSIPQELLSGLTQRRWLQLDSPVLGQPSNHEVTHQEQILVSAQVGESTDAHLIPKRNNSENPIHSSDLAKTDHGKPPEAPFR